MLLTCTEIEAILIVPNTPTLTQLDNTLRMFITFTGAYHGELFCRADYTGSADPSPDTYLQTIPDMLHAIDMLLHSELFIYHDARMVGIMMADAQEVRSSLLAIQVIQDHADSTRTPIHTSCIYCIT